MERGEGKAHVCLAHSLIEIYDGLCIFLYLCSIFEGEGSGFLQ